LGEIKNEKASAAAEKTNLNFGFAARCVEWLCPAVNATPRLGCAFTLGTRSILPEREGAPNPALRTNGRAQPFHTSGGEAEATFHK